MGKLTRGAVEMTWDPAVRLAEVRFTVETDATGEDAVAMVAVFRDWIGTDPEPFALLGDGARLRSLDAEYRSVWGNFFRQHRQDCCVAFFNLGAVIRIAADLFRIGTGLRLKVFAHEDEARSWLRRMGISA
jgi:hypothetical protein